MTKTDRQKDTGKLTRKQYEAGLRRLQIELCHLQTWVKAKGLRVIIVFEGRDGGQGGTIRAITERISQRQGEHRDGPRGLLRVSQQAMIDLQNSFTEENPASNQTTP